jgi:transcription elongation factor Elf1
VSKKLPDGYEVQTSYSFTCAACGHEQMARPSIMMHGFGLNTGHGKCMECGTFLHLEIDTEKQVMISQDWDEWLAEEAAASEESTDEQSS